MCSPCGGYQPRADEARGTMALLTNLPLSRKLAVVFAALAIIAGATLAFLYSRVEHMDETARFIDHTSNIIEAVDDSFVAMINQQSGLRGYLLTGEDRFLDPYRAGAAQFAKRMAEAKRLV